MNQPPLNPDALTRRDIMAGQIGVWIDEWDDGKADTGHVATHIANRLAENGWTTAAALPEVTSVEQLEALPVGSVIHTNDDDVARKTSTHLLNPDGPLLWEKFGEDWDLLDWEINLPARVLYHPEVKA